MSWSTIDCRMTILFDEREIEREKKKREKEREQFIAINYFYLKFNEFKFDKI